jgi:G6PDH family F420-dependent oxidoreductase
MIEIGYHLSCEEHPPDLLVPCARLAEEAGFDFVTISDHYHPWTDAQGQSAFVWSVIGAIAQVTERVPVGTAVTCPTVRIHPAVMAQAAATSATMLPGRFFFGVGTGEALNEHIFGDPWPSHDVRSEMLREAVEIIRRLWEGGTYSHYGEHYVVEQARIYTLPPEPPPIVMSAFGANAARLAGEIGDGFMNTSPDAELLGTFREAGGAGKPSYGKLDVACAPSEQEARRVAHQTWPTSGIPGELSQVLPTPAHFEQAASIVTEDMTAEAIVVSQDPDEHVARLREYEDAGYTHVTVQQCGSDQDRFFRFYTGEVLPRVRR